MAEAERPEAEAAVEKAPEPSEKPATPASPEEDWASRFKYLLADFENYRKRSDRERDGARHSARAEVLRALIPLYEAFERGLNAAHSLGKDDPLRKGLELVAREWASFWRSERVEPVARIGDGFRAEEHEAVGEAPAGPGLPEGSVAEVVQQGYRSPAGLLRPAKVIVVRVAPPEPSSSSVSPPPASPPKEVPEEAE